MDNYDQYDATGLAELVQIGAVTANEVLDAALDRLERVNPKINAVVNLQVDKARDMIAAGLPELYSAYCEARHGEAPGPDLAAAFAELEEEALGASS